MILLAALANIFYEAFERLEAIITTIGLCSLPAAISRALEVSSSKSLSPYSLKLSF
jgi:hypothetical protein